MLPTAPPLPPLDSSQYPPTQMDYFNDYANFYPVSSTREEFDVYQFQDQMTATEETSYQEQQNTFPDCWNALEQPVTTVGLPTTLPAAAGYGEHCCNLFIDRCLTHEPPESLLPTSSWTNQPGGYSQPSSSSYHWPEVGQDAQYYYPGSLSQDYSLPSAVVSKPPAMEQTFNGGKDLFSLKLRVLKYSPIINRPQLLGGKPKRAIYQHVLYGKC